MRKTLRRIFFLLILGLVLYKNVYKENYYLGNLMKSNDIATFHQTIMENEDLYELLETALLNGEEELTFINKYMFTQPQEIFDTLKSVYYNNPEILYYSASEYSLGKLKLTYSKDSSDIKSHQSLMKESKLKFINQYIKPEMSDYEKLLAAHDYIINNTRYDQDMIGDKYTPESHSAYGVLVLGKGVCEGYAKAFKYLLDEMNIENILILGESKGEKHAWNLINIEEEYYHVDVTWNDPITKDNTDIISYNYLNVTDMDLIKTHKWDKDLYPKANGEKYNYFRYNSLIINDYDEIKLYLLESMINKKNHVMIKTNKDHINNINSIIENIYKDNNKIIKLKSYSYFIDKDYGIIDLKFYY